MLPLAATHLTVLSFGNGRIRPFPADSSEDLAEEQLGAVLARVGEEVLGGADLDDLAVGHEHDAVGDLAGEAISWVTTIIVMPCWARSFIVSRTSLIISGSSADVGSSNSITFGFIASALAIATRCCWPPES